MSALVFLAVGSQVFFRPPSHPVTFHVDGKTMKLLNQQETVVTITRKN